MPIDTGVWTTWGTGTQDQSGDTLNQAATGVSGQYVGIYSNSTYDMTNKTVQVGIRQLPSGTAGNQAVLRVEIDSSNAVLISYTAGNLLCQKQVSNVTTDVSTQAWPAGTKGLKIVFDNAQSMVWFATTADGSTWTSRYNEALPIATTALRVHLFTGCYATVGSPGTTRWESINLANVADRGATVLPPAAAAAAAARAPERPPEPTDTYGKTVWNHPSLIAYWRLDEPSGTDAADSRRRYPGIYAGSPTLGVTGTNPSGGSAKAVSLNGTDQYVSIATTDIPLPSGFSVEAWVKPGAWPAAAQTTLINRMDVNGYGGFVLDVDSTGRFTLNIYEGAGLRAPGEPAIDPQFMAEGWGNCSTTLPLDPTQWHHVVATYDGTGGYIVVDGGYDVAGNGAIGSMFEPGSSYTQIARNIYWGTCWPGVIDEVALYGAPLDMPTIEDHYAKGVPPAVDAYATLITGTSGLLGYWRLGEASGTTATDSSGNTHDGLYQEGSTPDEPTGIGATGALLGVPNTGVDFQTTHHVNIPTDAAFELTGNLTLEAWVYPNTATPNGVFVHHGFGSQTSWNFRWAFTFNSLVPTLAQRAGSTLVVNASGGAVQGQWSHVAVTKSGTTVTHYLNGAANGSGTLTDVGIATGSGAGVGIAGLPDTGSGGTINGRLDEVAVYNVALSPAQILERFNTGQPPIPVAIGGVQAAATAAAPLPTLAPQRSATVIATPAAASAAGPLPTIVRQIQRTIVGVQATGSSAAQLPTLVAQRQPTIVGVQAVASSTAPLPTIVRQLQPTVLGTQAQAGSSAPLPTIVKSTVTTVIAVTATATAAGGDVTNDRIFPGQPIPTGAAEAGQTFELGLMFTPQPGVTGTVTGVAFYRTLADTQSFTISLYDYESGWTLLERKTVSSSTAGWQSVSFDEPEPIIYDGFAYLVTYWSPSGQFARTPHAFDSGIDTTYLHAYADGEGGASNGAFEQTGAPDGSFGPASFEASNYHVDVLFAVGGGAPTILTQRQPAIVGVQATATGAAPAATLAAQRQASLTSTLASATSAVLAPTVVKDSATTVSGVLATISSAALLPTQATQRQPSISGVQASATGAASLPTPAAQRQPVVVGLTATATTGSLLPTLAAQRQPTVVGIVAAANASAALPSASAGTVAVLAAVPALFSAAAVPPITVLQRSTTIVALHAQASADVLLHLIGGGTSATVLATPVQGQAGANLVTIAGQRQPTIVATAGLADAAALLTTQGTGVSRTVLALQAQGTSAAPLPTLAAQRSTTLVGALAAAVGGAAPATLAVQRLSNVLATVAASQGVALPSIQLTAGAVTIQSLAASTVTVAPSPTLVAQRLVQVSGLTAQANSSALLATLGTSSTSTVLSSPAALLAEAQLASAVSSGNKLVLPPVVIATTVVFPSALIASRVPSIIATGAQASVLARPAVIVAGISATALAMPAQASVSALAASVALVRQALVLAARATGSGAASAPGVQTGATLSLSVAQATAEALEPFADVAVTVLILPPEAEVAVRALPISSETDFGTLIEAAVAEILAQGRGALVYGEGGHPSFEPDGAWTNATGGTGSSDTGQVGAPTITTGSGRPYTTSGSAGPTQADKWR